MKDFKWLILIALLILIGCRGKNTTTNPEGSDIDSICCDDEVPDILIELDIDYSDNEYLGMNNTLKYKIVQNDHLFVMEPTSPYYDKYTSGQRFEIPEVVAYFEDDFIDANMYPKIYCYIQNNTEKDITISALDFVVENSSIDRLPYFNIATEDANSNCLVLANENWFNYGNIKFEYTILKKGETFSNYEKKINIPYFPNIYRLNFKQDLIEKGYNYEAIRRIVGDDIDDLNLENSDGCMNLCISEDELSRYSKLFYPFEVVRVKDEDNLYMGMARIYGRLSVENSDFTTCFKGQLSLSYPAGFGAAMDEDDSYDIELRTEGKDYTLTFPYNVVLTPGQSKKIGITLLCQKSSNHTIRIKAKNNELLDIYSVPIKLHYLNPRHSSKIIWQDVKQYYEAD